MFPLGDNDIMRLKQVPTPETCTNQMKQANQVSSHETGANQITSLETENST